MTDDAELWRLGASDIAAGVRSGAFSAREAVDSALCRLAAVNPAINAVVAQMPEEAYAAATEIDRRVAAGEDPGLLAGVPVTVKVNVDQTGHATTNGLRLREDLIAAKDNPVVANLRKAGAIIVGRTNMPAFGMCGFTRCALYGRTRNPRDPSLTPGGSSGGAGAAVAAGIGAIGHGTDIGGSIGYPAYACGVHGLRPTFGRIPSVNFSAPDPHIGAQLMAASGPLTRTVEDLRLAFRAMSRPDARDSFYVPAPGCLPHVPKRAALAVAPEGMRVAPEVSRALHRAARCLTGEGWTVEEASCPPLRETARTQAVLWLADMQRGIASALREEADPDSLFVFAQMQRLFPDIGFEAVMDALQRRAALVRAWQDFLAGHPILLLPVSAELPFPDLLEVESPEAFERVMEAQLTLLALPAVGVPVMTLSTGLVGTAPVGVLLVAPRYREDLLFEAGGIIERAGVPTSPIDPAE